MEFYAYHVNSIKDHLQSKVIMYFEMSTCQHNTGSLQKLLKDCLKKLTICVILTIVSGLHSAKYVTFSIIPSTIDYCEK